MQNRLEQLRERYGLSEIEGFVPTALPRVSFFWASEPVPRSPLIYEAGIVFVLQGDKTGYLDGREFYYDPHNYLIVTASIPFECATNATASEPLLGLFVDLDFEELHDIVATLQQSPHSTEPTLKEHPSGIRPVPSSPEMHDCVDRLVRCLCSPLDTQVLGPALLREIVYRALLGEHGPALIALTQQSSQVARVSRALLDMRSRYQHSLSIEDLAKNVGLSASAFHRAFKSVTGSTPLQYLKKLRLTRAKSLILHEGLNVSQAAARVSYESPSQFSREFKRYFGVNPTESTKLTYQQLRYE